MDENKPRHSMHDLLRMAFRRRRLFLFGWAAFAVLVIAVAHYLPLKFTGKAVFEFGLEAAAEQISKTSAESFDTIKERLRHDLAGPQAMEAAASELGLFKGLPRDSEGQLIAEGQAAKQELVQKYAKNVLVVWEARSNQEDLISVSFTSEDPSLAEQVPNTLVANYIDKTFDRIRTGLKLQYDFLRGKVDDSDKVLAELAKKRIKFETDNAGVLPESPGQLQDRMQRIRSDIDALKRQQTLAKANLIRLQSLQLQTTQPGATAYDFVEPGLPGMYRPQDQLEELRDELEMNITIKHMKEEHPTIVALRKRIARLEERISRANSVAGPGRTDSLAEINLTMAIAATQSELDSATTELGRLESLLVNYEKLWANFGPVRQEYLRIEKEYQDRKAEADQWRGRLQEVEVTLAAVLNNRLTRIRALQPAQPQMLPSFPPLPGVLLVALAGGLAVGGALVLAAGLMDRTIATSEEASEHFDLPVLGVIGEIVTPRQQMMRKLRRYTLRPAVALVLMAVVGLSVMSIVLRLQYPQAFNDWRQSPARFLMNQVVHPADYAASVR